MVFILCALIVASAVAWAGWTVAHQVAGRQREGDRRISLLALFAPGKAAAAEDPRALLIWQPLAITARALYPEDFAALDRASGAAFPFSPDHCQDAHSTWTTEWLSWERNHDGEFKLRAALLAQELGAGSGTPEGRARLDALERERLDSYQRRYEEYQRVARGLQALLQRV